ncbi:hypothetical protein SK128_007668, partial [Halocaridina rubra]
ELQRSIIQLKVKNLETVAELEETRAMAEKQNINIIRLKHELRDRERLLETLKDASRCHATRLHTIIRDLRFEIFCICQCFGEHEDVVVSMLDFKAGIPTIETT